MWDQPLLPLGSSCVVAFMVQERDKDTIPHNNAAATGPCTPYLAGRMGGAVGSGLLITSTKKSNVSVCATAACTSSLCRFLRLFFSAKHHALQTVPHTRAPPDGWCRVSCMPRVGRVACASGCRVVAPDGELQNEEFARLGKQHRRLCSNHSHLMKAMIVMLVT